MARIEVFESEADAPLFTGEFAFLPRVGDYLSKETDGYFTYFNVVEVWHREQEGDGRFVACVRVKRDDQLTSAFHPLRTF
jgi:hypothetical protein